MATMHETFARRRTYLVLVQVLAPLCRFAASSQLLHALRLCVCVCVCVCACVCECLPACVRACVHVLVYCNNTHALSWVCHRILEAEAVEVAAVPQREARQQSRLSSARQKSRLFLDLFLVPASSSLFAAPLCVCLCNSLFVHAEEDAERPLHAWCACFCTRGVHATQIQGPFQSHSFALVFCFAKHNTKAYE